MALLVVSWVTVAASSRASGGSFVGATCTVTVAVLFTVPLVAV